MLFFFRCAIISHFAFCFITFVCNTDSQRNIESVYLIFDLKAITDYASISYSGSVGCGNEKSTFTYRLYTYFMLNG